MRLQRVGHDWVTEHARKTCFNPSNGSSFLTVQWDWYRVHSALTGYIILHILTTSICAIQTSYSLTDFLSTWSISYCHTCVKISMREFDIFPLSSVNFHLMHFLPSELNLTSKSSGSLHFFSNLTYIYLCWGVLGLYCCVGFPLIVASRGYSRVSKHKLLLVAAFPVAEHGL